MQEEDFDFEEYEKTLKSKPDYILDQCYDMIMHISEDSIISLYTCFDNFLFQDIDYGKVISIMPKWVADTGIGPESACDKDSFEKLKSTFSHPYLNRFIYYYDVWSLIAAVQDRLQAVEYFMQDFYSSIPCFLKYDKKKYTSCIRVGGISSTNAFVSLNSIFVSLASVFDLLSKIAVEQYKFGQYVFSKYKKMKSEGVLYNYTYNDINPSLKGKGLLFLAEHLGLSAADTIAFGDSSNDLSMLLAAGVGVAMGNASESVKSACTAITDTNEQDGVAVYLEQFILK